MNDLIHSSCWQRLEDAHTLQLEEALKFIRKALTNHRLPEYVSTQKALEKEVEERKRKAYLDPVKAAEHKNKGNDLFKAGMHSAFGCIAFVFMMHIGNRTLADGRRRFPWCSGGVHGVFEAQPG